MTTHDGILRVLACGSVDDGKSTMIGHLLHLTGNLYDDQVLMLEQESARNGTTGGGMDYSLLLDGLTAEREQGITIDVAYRYFATEQRHFIVADTPGHERYTRNMATAASHCGAALILVDVNQGVLPQTRRHALICALMGIRRLLFVVNKMDMVGWDEQAFRYTQAQCGYLAQALERFGLPRAACVAVPASSLRGDNLVSRSPRMPWYDAITVMDWLHAVEPGRDMERAALRFPVQYVIKGARQGGGWQHGADVGLGPGGTGTFRAYAGTVVSGSVRRGDRVAVLPSGLRTHVRGMWCGDRPVREASAGMAVALSLEGEHDIARGDMVVAEEQQAQVAHLFKVRLVWMDEQPLFAGRQYLFRGV
ncbi:MAG TPA: GTP-binding protein, partial [Desulfuromonadaceae bacterium]